MTSWKSRSIAIETNRCANTCGNSAKALTGYAIKKQKGLLSDQETMGWFCPFCTNLMLRSTYKCPNCGYIPSYYQGKSPK